MKKIVLYEANQFVAAIPPRWLTWIFFGWSDRWTVIFVRNVEPGDEYLPFGEKEDETPSHER